MKKRHTLSKIILAVSVLLLVTAFCVFKDFIFAKNELFQKTGTKIQLDCASIPETKITKSIFEIRKIQNYIEKVDKESYVVDDDVRVYGWKIKGYIVVGGKVQNILVRGNILIIDESAYKVADENFQQKMVAYFNEID